MITVEIEIYSPVHKEYHIFEAIVDTGASFCVIPKHVADRIGFTEERKKVHMWQVCDPLVLTKGKINTRFREKLYGVEAVVVDIPSKYQRDIIRGEECTRPEHRNPLSNRIILGENFLNKLSETERRQIGI